MNQASPELQKLKLLNEWELYVFIGKTYGESIDSIALRRATRPKAIEFLVGNCYDKLGLAYLTSIERREAITKLAENLQDAFASEDIPRPSIRNLAGTPPHEMPSQRAQAAVINDEHQSVWPRLWPVRQSSPTGDQKSEEQSGEHESSTTDSNQEPNQRPTAAGAKRTEPPQSPPADAEVVDESAPTTHSRTRKSDVLLGCGVLIAIYAAIVIALNVGPAVLDYVARLNDVNESDITSSWKHTVGDTGSSWPTEYDYKISANPGEWYDIFAGDSYDTDKTFQVQSILVDAPYNVPSVACMNLFVEIDEKSGISYCVSTAGYVFARNFYSDPSDVDMYFNRRIGVPAFDGLLRVEASGHLLTFYFDNKFIYSQHYWSETNGLVGLSVNAGAGPENATWSFSEFSVSSLPQ